METETSASENKITCELLALGCSVQELRSFDGSYEALLSVSKSIRDQLKYVRELITNFKTDYPSQKDITLSFEEQILSLQASFRKFSVAAENAMNAKDRTSLLGMVETAVGPSKSDRTREEILSESSKATDQLHGLRQRLSDITEHNRRTIETLVESSSVVVQTNEEFKSMGSYLAVTRKLLSKYDRRELTDKVVLFLAFAFFLACCLYVVKKRLF